MMAALPDEQVLDEAPGVIASPERIDAWMAVARPGDQFVYASRCSLPIGSKSAAHMRALYARGLVRLHCPPKPGHPTIFNYLAIRTEKPTAVTRPVRPTLVAPAAALVDGEAVIVDALLPILDRFARHGRPCPTDRQLGARADVSEAEVKAGLVAMVAANLIRIQGCPAPTYRRIVIVATGQITGLAA